MSGMPETDAAPLTAALREAHRRVLGLFRPLADSRDDFERIEMASVICEEIRELLAADRKVVQPLLVRAGMGIEEDPGLLRLVERFESLSPEEAGFDALSLQLYERVRDHVCTQEDTVFPQLASLDTQTLSGATQGLRDLRERILEH